MRATSEDDFATLRTLFDHPSLLDWGGQGRLSDEGIRESTLERANPTSSASLSTQVTKTSDSRCFTEGRAAVESI